MTKVIGLTGGIATGKSSADQFFKKQNIPVIDADLIAHQLYEPGQKGYELLVEKYGSKLLKPNQELDRQKLAKIVVNSKTELVALNQLIVPLIYQEIERQIQALKNQKTPLVVLDAPTLFETNGQKYCDEIIVITASEKLQIERLAKRNNLSVIEAKKRLKMQLPLTNKVKLANYVVENTGTIKMLEDKLAKILLQIRREE